MFSFCLCWLSMQINSRGVLLKWGAISLGIAFCIVFVIVLIAPTLISENLIKQKVLQVLDDKLESSYQVGSISFSWPNRIGISYLTLQEQMREHPIRLEDIQCRVSLIPLLWKKPVIRKISVHQAKYEDQFLIKNFVTDEFSFRDDILFINARLLVNDGPTTIKGTIDLHRREPEFDIFIDTRDAHSTHDMLTLRLLPLFTVKEGEIGGILNLKGTMRGRVVGREALNEYLDADVVLQIKNGYIRGSKAFSSLLDILGVENTYSFDSLDTMVRIKGNTMSTPKLEMKGPLMDMNASGVAEFEGPISYDAVVMFHKEHLGKNIEKIVGLILKQNTLPIEIRGTTREPKVSIKLSKDSLEHVMKGLVNDFLSGSKKKENNRK